MAGIIFSVDEDIQEINRLTKEVERLKKALFELPKTTNQIEFAKMCEPLEKQLQSVLQQIDNIKRAIIDANNHIGETAKRIDDATARVTSVQAKFITPQTESIQPSTSVRANASTITQTTNALQEQSDAYVGLRMEYEEYMNSVEHNTIKMLKLKDEIQGYNNTLRQLEMGTPSQKNQSRIVEITKQLEEAKIRLAQVRSELKAGLKLQVAAPDSMDALNQQLGKMREFYRSLTEEERNSPFGIELANGIAQADQRIKELDASIGNHQRNIGNYASGLQSIRAEQRGMIGEIATLTMAYREMTAAEQQSANGTALKDKIEELTTKAAQLKDVMADTNRAISSQANDTSSFTAISEGINLLISGYGLAKGAAEMLGMSEEDLIAVQTKLQAAFVASNALISMQKTLQKESTLMQGISILQTKAAAKAINIKTAAEGKGIIATTGATIAQKALNAVAKANPYVLLATALASVVGALWAFSKGASDAKKKQEEFNNSVVESATPAIAKIIELSDKWKRLGNDIAAQQKFISDYQDGFDQLGASIKTVSDAETAFVNGTSKFIEAIVRRNIASAYKDNIAECVKKLVQLKQEEIEINDKTYTDILPSKVKSPAQYATPGAQAETQRYSRGITAEEQKNAALEANKKQYANAEKALHGYLDAMAEAQGISDHLMEDLGLKTQESEREYWEKELADCKKIYEGLQKTDPASAEALARVKEAEAELEKFNKYNTEGTSKNTEQFIAEQTKTHQAVLDLIDKQATERANNEKEHTLRVQQAKIDGMAEGTDKVLAQMELDFKKEQHQLEKDKQEAITAEIARQKAVFDAREDEKAAKNSKYAKATFDPKTDIDTTAINVISSQYDELAKLLTDKQNQIRSERQEAEISAMNEYLKEFGTYLEKRQAMIALANEKIAKATTEGEKKSIAAQLTRDLSDLDIEATKTTNAISKLFGDMSKQTVSDLRAIADAGQQALDFLTSGQWDETKGLQFGITKEMFETLRKSPAELEKILKAIRDMNAEADNSENAFNKIKIGLDKIFNNKPDTKEFQEGFNEMLSGVQAVTQALSFMSDALSNLGAGGAADVLNEAVGALNAGMQGAQAGAAFGPWGAAAGAAIGVASSLVGTFSKLHDKKHEKRIQAMQEQVEALEKSYDNLGDSVEDAFSKDASNLLNQQNEVLERQKVLIQNQIKEEEAKKNTDNDRIKEWKEQLESIDKQIGENKEKAVDAIFGEDLKSAIENFADAYANAWANGENRAESAKDTVKKMMQQMVTESIKAAIKSSNSMEQIRKKLQEFYADNVLSGWEQDYVLNMAEELQRELDEQFGWANKLMSGNNPGAQSTATAGLYETLSEDTGQALEGRFTAIQDSNERIAQSAQEITAFNEITSNYLDRMANLQKQHYDLANDTRDIIYNSYLELNEINTSLKTVVKQNKDDIIPTLNRIDKNTKQA